MVREKLPAAGIALPSNRWYVSSFSMKIIDGSGWFLPVDEVFIDCTDFLFVGGSTHEPAESFLLNEHTVEIDITPRPYIEGQALFSEGQVHLSPLTAVNPDSGFLAG